MSVLTCFVLRLHGTELCVMCKNITCINMHVCNCVQTSIYAFFFKHGSHCLSKDRSAVYVFQTSISKICAFAISNHIPPNNKEHNKYMYCTYPTNKNNTTKNWSAKYLTIKYVTRLGMALFH